MCVCVVFGSTAVNACNDPGPHLAWPTLCAALWLCCRQPSDVEVFAIQTNATGNVTVQLLGAPAWGSVLRSNLNASVTVQSMQGAVLGQASGVGVIAFSLPSVVAGTYFIFVRPTAAGNPLTTGYSTYGCQGQYELVVTYPLVDQTGGLFMVRVHMGQGNKQGDGHSRSQSSNYLSVSAAWCL